MLLGICILQAVVKQDTEVIAPTVKDAVYIDVVALDTVKDR